MKLRFLFASLALLATEAAAAQPDHDARVERSRSVAGVLIEEIAESDGGTLVRLTRRAAGYRFGYYLEFWRGNGGVVVGATFRRGECRSGDAGIIQPTEETMTRANLERRLAFYLRECPLPRASEGELHRAIGRAWPLFSIWAQEALAAIQAENAAIADYGRER